MLRCLNDENLLSKHNFLIASYCIGITFSICSLIGFLYVCFKESKEALSMLKFRVRSAGYTHVETDMFHVALTIGKHTVIWLHQLV